MKRILITGITGFVGTSLVNYFWHHKDVEIFGHSRDIVKAKSQLPNTEFVEELTPDAIDENKIDCIIHLAGIAHDLSGNYKKEDYQRVNYEGTKKIFDAFTSSPASTFVLVSSIKAVVDHADSIVDESFEPNPKSDYGISKRQAEEYILGHLPNEKQVFILRPCMIHGPGNKGNLNLLYKFVKTGIPYPLAAFENKRSFLSIDNLCFVIQNIAEGKLRPDTYQLADTDPVSTNDLVRLIGKTMGKRVFLWKFPKPVIWALAKAGSWIRMPFNTSTITKLCGNMEVSNQKLLLNLNHELPVTSRQGLQNTIRSFDE